jgi:16S rRNA (cytidine1402-2'-O)-methyltransferase
MFEGFLPAKLVARQKVLEGLRHEVRTAVFYESSHRIAETLADLATVLGLDRRIGIARELTKLHEEVWTGPAGDALRWLEAIPERRQGEFVVMIAGAQPDDEAQHVSIDVERLLRALSHELPLSRAAQVVADLTGIKRNRLYDRALELRAERN